MDPTYFGQLDVINLTPSASTSVHNAILRTSNLVFCPIPSQTFVSVGQASKLNFFKFLHLLIKIAKSGKTKNKHFRKLLQVAEKFKNTLGTEETSDYLWEMKTSAAMIIFWGRFLFLMHLKLRDWLCFLVLRRTNDLRTLYYSQETLRIKVSLKNSFLVSRYIYVTFSLNVTFTERNSADFRKFPWDQHTYTDFFFFFSK